MYIIKGILLQCVDPVSCITSHCLCNAVSHSNSGLTRYGFTQAAVRDTAKQINTLLWYSVFISPKAGLISGTSLYFTCTWWSWYIQAKMAKDSQMLHVCPPWNLKYFNWANSFSDQYNGPCIDWYCIVMNGYQWA